MPYAWSALALGACSVTTPPPTRATPAPTPSEAATSSPLVGASGCPRELPLEGASVWTKTLDARATRCSGRFFEGTNVGLDCYDDARDAAAPAFDLFGRPRATVLVEPLLRARLLTDTDYARWEPLKIDPRMDAHELALPDGGKLYWGFRGYLEEDEEDDIRRQRFVRHDSRGQLVWETTLLGQRFTVAASADGYYVTGLEEVCPHGRDPSLDEDPTTPRGIVYRLKSDASVAWQKQLDCGTVPMSTTLSAPDEVAVAGAFVGTYDDDPREQDYFLVVFDRAGRQLSRREGPNPLARANDCSLELRMHDANGQQPKLELFAWP